MLKGLNRKVVVIKDVKSRYFDEAHFYVKALVPAISDKKEMMTEANRIIQEFSAQQTTRSNTISVVEPPTIQTSTDQNKVRVTWDILNAWDELDREYESTKQKPRSKGKRPLDEELQGQEAFKAFDISLEDHPSKKKKLSTLEKEIAVKFFIYGIASMSLLVLACKFIELIFQKG